MALTKKRLGMQESHECKQENNKTDKDETCSLKKEINEVCEGAIMG